MVIFSLPCSTFPHCSLVVEFSGEYIKVKRTKKKNHNCYVANTVCLWTWQMPSYLVLISWVFVYVSQTSHTGDLIENTSAVWPVITSLSSWVSRWVTLFPKVIFMDWAPFKMLSWFPSMDIHIFVLLLQRDPLVLTQPFLVLLWQLQTICCV